VDWGAQICSNRTRKNEKNKQRRKEPNETKRKKNGRMGEQKKWNKDGVKETKTEVKENNEGTRVMTAKQK
jgi:hypothetical protein